MDPKYTGAIMFRHLDSQNKLLMDAYRAMTHELHKLQVEEEMLMRGFYDLLAAQGLTTKKQDGTAINILDASELVDSETQSNMDRGEKQ